MARVIRNKLTDLVRERGSDKRKIAHLTISLDEPLGDDEDSPALIDKIDAQTISDGASNPFLGNSPEDRSLEGFSRNLPPNKKQLCLFAWREGPYCQRGKRVSQNASKHPIRRAKADQDNL
jgi:hypothetical protein